MIPMALEEIANAVGGVLHDVPDPHLEVTGPVTVDSRQVVPGGMFAALVGEHADGHDFAEAAWQQGAVVVLAARPVGVPCVVVADVLDALGRLARHLLDRRPGLTVIGITGSAGKTSTKDLLAQLLEPWAPTVAPSGSLNNELGVPLTVLAADLSTRFLVVEMGARGAGHLAYLCRVAPPRIGVELMVGQAHVGEFGGRPAIAAAKAELVEALPPEGVAVLNADDPLVRDMAHRTAASLRWFGLDPGADVRAADIEVDARGQASFRLVIDGETAPVRLPLVGVHQVSNALAAAAVAHQVGRSVSDVAAGLSAAQSRSRWRMEVVHRPDGVTVVNDAYNASPESMRAALQSLAVLGEGRRTWAVLGEMRELGADTQAEHDAVGRLAVRLDISRLVAVGEPARAIHLGAYLEGSWGEESTFVADVDAAIALLREEVRPGDVVLVKASRAAGLETVAAALTAEVAP